MIHQMKEMHASYLNHRYDLRVLEKWRQISCQMPGIWQGHSLYEYIEAHLGYRFVVENLEFISEKKRISLRFAVKNKGFGACWFETEVELIQETEAEWHRYPLGNLLQDLACEDHRQIVVPLKPEEGKIFLCAYRKSDGRMISLPMQHPITECYIWAVCVGQLVTVKRGTAFNSRRCCLWELRSGFHIRNWQMECSDR